MSEVERLEAKGLDTLAERINWEHRARLITELRKGAAWLQRVLSEAEAVQGRELGRRPRMRASIC